MQDLRMTWSLASGPLYDGFRGHLPSCLPVPVMHATQVGVFIIFIDSYACVSTFSRSLPIPPIFRSQLARVPALTSLKSFSCFTVPVSLAAPPCVSTMALGVLVITPTHSPGLHRGPASLFAPGVSSSHNTGLPKAIILPLYGFPCSRSYAVFPSFTPLW